MFASTTTTMISRLILIGKNFIKDLNGCGFLGPISIPVLGLPKYFTPNGDGLNDFWKIEGVNETIQPNTTVLIYDRYGKLLKQLLVQYGHC